MNATPPSSSKCFRHGSQAGYSLIELVIALAIFSIGILAVAKMQLAAVNNNAQGNLITQATMLAEMQIEQLKNSVDVTTLADMEQSGLDRNGEPGGRFTRKTTVTNPLGGDYSRQIEVAVSWQRYGRTRRVVLTSLTQGNGI